MPNYAILVSPRAQAAFFDATLSVVRQEFESVFPGASLSVEAHGAMQFLCADLPVQRLPDVLRLSFCQGVFEINGSSFVPVGRTDDFALHPDFVWGEKYRGKTNETLTQLLINTGLSFAPHAQTLLDPMCGRATTLLWALRYGLDASGIERDSQALADVHRGLKKWTKLHRQKHKLTDGWVQKTNKQGVGKFLSFTAAGNSMRLISGDSANADMLLQRKKFDLIVTDIPYGVQHHGSTQDRNPLETLRACAPAWRASLAQDGAMVIAFNAYIPKRTELIDVFEAHGLTAQPTDLEHRMSESILRDVVVLT